MLNNNEKVLNLNKKNIVANFTFLPIAHLEEDLKDDISIGLIKVRIERKWRYIPITQKEIEYMIKCATIRLEKENVKIINELKEENKDINNIKNKENTTNMFI